MSRSPLLLTLDDLAARSCEPCEQATPLARDQVQLSLNDLPGWSLRDGSIQKEFRFKQYGPGLEFAYAVGRIADEQDHHPEILIRWRRVTLTFSTHSIKGLSTNDFVMAAKSELEYQKHSSR